MLSRYWTDWKAAGGLHMMSLMEAIQNRRSIRSFKPDPVPEEVIRQMLEAARLAPSGSNRQPWRFQVITDRSLRERIFTEATFGARYILEAPVMVVCGFELLTYVKGNPLAPQTSAIPGAESDDLENLKQFIPDAQMNTAIAIEHLVLAATANCVGTCWVQRIKPGQMAKILGWPRHIVALLVVVAGYANEQPAPKPRLPLEQILVKGNI
jgi:nitroreductase